MAKKMKELDIKETSSKSLLSNVLDMDDDFRRSTLPRIATPIPHPSHVRASQNNPGILRLVERTLFVVFRAVRSVTSICSKCFMSASIVWSINITCLGAWVTSPTLAVITVGTMPRHPSKYPQSPGSSVLFSRWPPPVSATESNDELSGD